MNIGLIGFGYWGKKLYERFINLGQNVSVVCDISNDVFEDTGHPVIFTNDTDRVIKDSKIDAVAIATSPISHFYLARNAIECGKHVFVTKPTTLGLEPMKELLHPTKILFTDLTYLQALPLQGMKNLYNKSAYSLNVFTSLRLNRGKVDETINCIYDLAAHDFSIFLSIFNTVKLTGLSCMGYKPEEKNYFERAEIDIKDDLTGIQGRIYLSWAYNNKVRAFNLTSSDFYNDDFIAYDQNEPDVLKTNLLLNDKTKLNGYQRVVYEQKDALLETCREFIRIVNTEQADNYNRQLSLEIAALTDCAVESANKNGAYTAVRR